MKTFIEDSTLFLKQGIQLRYFVKIGSTLLLQGTKTTGSYEDRINSFGEITQSINPSGGMASVSGASVQRIILDERFTLCTEASLTPLYTGVIPGVGRLLKQSDPLGTYLSARDATDATDFQAPALVIGRKYNSGSAVYSVWRSPLEFTIPAMTTIEDAYIQLTGTVNLVSSAETIYGIAGTWTSPITTDAFDAFTGWAASGAYTVTNLLETWTTAEYGTTTYLRFNAAGLAEILGAAGGTFRVMLLSSRDVLNSAAPSGNDYVQFESSTATLNLRYDSKTLDNAEAQILVGLEPLPAIISSTTIEPVWTGVVDEYSIGDKRADFTCKQNDHKKNCLLPSKIINTTDWSNCPEVNIGKPYPIIYGTFAKTGLHKHGVGNYTFYGPSGDTKPATYYSYPDCFKCPVISVDGVLRTILIAGHDVAFHYTVSGGGSTNTDLLFAKGQDDEAAFAHLIAEDYSTPALNPTRRILKRGKNMISFPPDNFIAAWRSSFTILPNDHSSLRVTNPAYAYDSDTDTSAFLEPHVGNPSELHLYFDDSDYNAGSSYGCLVFYIEEYDTNAVWTDLSFSIYENVKTAEDDPDSWSLIHTYTAADIFDSGYDAAGYAQTILTFYDGSSNPIVLTKHKFVISYTATGASSGFYVKDVCFVVSNDAGNETDFYGTGTGRYDDESGTITGTASATLENPAHVIEGFARNELNLTTAEIDTAAFDTAATARTGDKLAFQINEQRGARDILNDLAYQSRLFLWWDEFDRLTVKAIDYDASFPNSLTNTPDALDIFTTTGDPVDGSLTHHKIYSNDEDFLTQTPIDEVYCDYAINYCKNYATDKYSKVLTCNKDGNNLTDGYLSGYTGAELQALCAASNTKYGTVNTLTVDAWAIRDDATAHKLIQHLITRHYRRWNLTTFKTGFSALCFEPTDMINIRDDRIEDLYGVATMNIKKWMIQDFKPSLNDALIGIVAVEV